MRIANREQQFRRSRFRPKPKVQADVTLDSDGLDPPDPCRSSEATKSDHRSASSLGLLATPTQKSAGGSISPQPSLGTQSSKKHTTTLGFQSFYEPNDAVGDIVFVHGLGGSSRGTWSWSRETDSFWPTWLSEEDEMLAKFRMSTFGYAAKFRDSNAPENLDIVDFAQDLLLQLLAIIGNESTRPGPILFVVHSLGGLVVKKALCLGKLDQKYSEVASRCRGIIFLATPHRGSKMAKILNNVLAASPLTTTKPYIAGLEKQSTTILDINESFTQHCDGLLLCSFFETLKTSMVLTKHLVSGILKKWPNPDLVLMNCL